MKKQFVVFCTFLFSTILIFSSCQKKDNPPPIKTKTELLSEGKWKFKSAFVGTTDYSSNLQTCQKDNILTFNASLTGNVDEGATKCDPSDPQIVAFTWKFQANETELFISTPLFTGGNNTFSLISLTATELVVSTGFSVGPGPVVNVIITFTH